MLTCDKENREYIGEVMTNFDHSIDNDIAEQLKDTNFYAGYSAWDFHGSVWFENGEYHCQIKRYGNHIDTISNEDLQGIMNEASEKYGYE